MSKKKTEWDDEEVERVLREAELPGRAELVATIEERLADYSKKEQEHKPLKFGRYHVFELVLEGIPPRILISPLPKDQMFKLRKRDVSARGWFAGAHTARAVTKLVGVMRHALWKRRVGIYLLVMSEGLIKHHIEPDEISDLKDAERMDRKIEEYEPYVTLQKKLLLDDVRQRLRRYEEKKKKESKLPEYEELGIDYFITAATAFSEAYKAAFSVYEKLRRGKLGFLPSWETIKKALPYLIIIGVIGITALYLLTIWQGGSIRPRLLITGLQALGVL